MNRYFFKQVQSMSCDILQSIINERRSEFSKSELAIVEAELKKRGIDPKNTQDLDDKIFSDKRINTKKITLLGWSAILLIAYFIVNKTIANIEYHKTIKQAICYIEQGNFEDASIITNKFSKYTDSGFEPDEVGHEEGYILHFYAYALDAWNDKEYSTVTFSINLAKEYFGQYTGKYKENMNKLLLDSQPLKEAADKLEEVERKRFEATRNQRGVKIGMSPEEVKQSRWGKPQHINRTTTAYGVDEQWVYSNNNYLYFKTNEYGLLELTSIQN